MTLQPARLDLVARLMTAAFVLSTVTGLGLATIGPGSVALLAAALILIALVCVAASPRAYELDADGLTIRRRVGSLRIVGPLRAERVPQRALLGAKLLGSGGLCGYLGVYRPSTGGACQSSVTSRDRAVLVRGSARGVLVSPADPAALIEAVGGNG